MCFKKFIKIMRIWEPCVHVLFGDLSAIEHKTSTFSFCSENYIFMFIGIYALCHCFG